MPPKRRATPTSSAKAPVRNTARKALRPADTKKKKKQTPARRPVVVKKSSTKKVSADVDKRLTSLLENVNVDAKTIVDFIVHPSCGIESLHRGNATPFIKAVEWDRLDVVQLLLSNCSPNVNAADATGRTALHRAANNDNPEMIGYLVENGAVIDAVDKYGGTPLFWAVYNIGQDGTGSDAALSLLQLGADPSIPGEDQNTPLHIACCYGMADLTTSLFAKGAPVDAVNILGQTPIEVAIEEGYTDLVFLLKGERKDRKVKKHKQRRTQPSY